MRDRYSFEASEIIGKRSVKRGDTIMKSEPFAYVINNSLRGQFCDYCFASHRDKKLYCCKGCQFLWYCDEMCQFAGQTVHKLECSALKRFNPREPRIFVRLIARVINRLKNGGENYSESYGENKGRKFKDLMNHYRDIKEDVNAMRDVHGLMEELKEFIGEEKFPNESDFIGIYGRILVNRYCLMDNLHSPIGSAIYLAASIFDHSCVPNAYPSFEKNKVVIRSLVDWEKLDLNKVFISYVDLVMTKEQRIKQLSSHWYFICRCPLCSSEKMDLYENCIKCENPMCETLIQVNEKPDSQFSCWEPESVECPECRLTVDEDTISEYQSVIAFTRHRLKGMKEDDPCIETCLAILEKQRNLVPPLNVWRVRSLDYAFNATLQRGVWIRAMEYGKSNMEGIKLYYGPKHPAFGLFLMKLCKVCMYLKLYREGIKYGEEAENILKIALGEKHLLITRELKRFMETASEDIDILLERRMEAKKNNHDLVCKHCGKRRGIVSQVEKKSSDEKYTNDHKRDIRKNGLTKITNRISKKSPHEHLINTNGISKEDEGEDFTHTNGVYKESVKEKLKSMNTEKFRTVENSESNKQSVKTKQLCKFTAAGESKARLSERVLDYLLSLQDF